MSYFASYSDVRITEGSIAIPLVGTWVADLTLATADTIAPSGKVVIGDLELVGAVVPERSEAFAGLRRARLVGGAAGWRKAIDARSYNNPAGIVASMILGDAAGEVGETVKIAAGLDVPLGTSYVRAAGAAGHLLRILGAPLWWVDPKGVTRVGPRDLAGSAIASAFNVTRFDGATKNHAIATETFADWMPGRTFSSLVVPDPQTIAATRIQVDNKGTARVEVLAS